MCLSTLNGDGTVCMDSQNGKGSNSNRLQLVRQREMIVDADLLSNLILMKHATMILTHQSGVSLQLLISRCGHNVNKHGDVDVHISSKHHGARSIAL